MTKKTVDTLRTLTPEQQRLWDNCTQLQRNFAAEYTSGKHGSKAAIYRAAGGSGIDIDTQSAGAIELLRNPKVIKLIDKLQVQSSNKLIMTREESLERYTCHAAVSADDFYERDAKGRIVIKDFDELSDNAKKSIKTITPLASGGYKLELYDAHKAMDKLAEMQGWNAAQETTININHNHSEIQAASRALDDHFSDSVIDGELADDE